MFQTKSAWEAMIDVVGKIAILFRGRAAAVAQTPWFCEREANTL